jgi:pyruvate,water dikinase
MAGTINGFGYLRLDFHLNRHPLWTARLIVGFFRFHLARLPRRWREQILPRHTQRIAEIRTVGLTALNNDAILALITDVEELSAEYWAIIGGLAWYWNTGEWLLAAMYPRLTGSDAGRARLLQGFSTKTSEAEEALYDLARNTDSAGFQADIRASFDALLDRYGHQVYNLDFIEPTPAEQPAALEATMRAYRDGLAEDPRDRLRALANRRDAQEAATLAALRRSPVRRRILTRLLRWSRLGAQLRDEALFAFTLGWPVMRRGYLELGRRLVDAGALRTADDVFFLTGDEVRAASRSPAVTDAGHKAARDLSELTARRRATRERQRLLRPPLLVPADARVRLGALDITALAVMRTESTSDSASGLRGSPVSPGRVTAPACVVLSVADFGKLRPGDVLVAPQITPAWSSLLAVAGGCVTDVGGALSHGSIVAREYGIPAVMGTIDATRHIQDGQVVTVDGDRGLVG